MKSITLQNWKFCPVDETRAFHTGFDDSRWLNVVVPHDWSVAAPFSREHSSGTGYLPGGVGWYRTYFSFHDDFETVRLNFDGVYKNAKVWLNGNYLGARPNGYIGFTYDVSSFIKRENVVCVRVEHNDIADSRWFTGSGIYRKVTVTALNAPYIEKDSVVFSFDGENVHITADVVGEISDVEVRLTGVNEYAWKARLKAGKLVINEPVKNAELWSVVSPALYELSFTARGERLFGPIRVGLRTCRFDADEGFFLNGINMKLKGVCVHHDAGCLGAAVYQSVWRERFIKLKEMGANAIRGSHNPHMPEMLCLCDELGLLFIDEAFDEWEGCKNKWSRGHNVYPPVYQGYAEDFTQWGERDLADMIIRDRNHPCVIAWSLGNEVDYPNDPYVHPMFEEMTGNNDNGKPAQEMAYDEGKPSAERLPVIAAKLAKIAREHDNTRPVAIAAAFPELMSKIGFFDPFDIVGYNYKEHLYEQDHKRFPNLPIIGSENGHEYAKWAIARDAPYIAAQFLWTGVDFLGEARGWPVRGSLCGLIDAAGFEKPAYYRRKAMWSDKPFLYLAADYNHSDCGWNYKRSWDFAKGETVSVICYTNLEGAELFVNGKSFGYKERTDEHILWAVPFERGILKIVSGGITDTIVSTLPAVDLELAMRGQPELSGEYTFYQIEIKTTDENGELCADCSALLKYAVENGLLLGVENGDLSDLTEYSSNARRVRHGKSVAYVLTKGAARLTVSGEKFVGKAIELNGL